MADATIPSPSDTSGAATVTAEGADPAERVFSRSVVISGIRCTLTYVIFPFVAPLIGIAASVGQIAGLAVTRGQHEMWPVDLAILSAQAVPFGICAWLGSGARRLLGGTFRVAGKGMRVATWPARRLLAGHRKSHPTPPELPTSRRDDHPAARRMFI